ncbi:MAG TPA: DinB family protein [Candidatus Angelobacter sp.]|nr:DinB family protein [Candidatus Angelobacter sp.]
MVDNSGLNLNLSHLVDYTGWERQKWHEWLARHGDAVLKTSVGEHGDGRFQSVGDYIRHIFSAETRYVDRLSNRPLTDTASVANDNIEKLFAFGRQSRESLRKFLEVFPPGNWDTPQELKIVNSSLTVTPRKIIVHTLLHEIRHWAQIATLFRLNGLKGDFHDFLFSPVLGGEIKRATGT